MFYSVLAAIILVFAGSTILWSLLKEHPILFLGYWAACVWIIFLAVLLALYDMAKVRQEGRVERQRLRAEYLESIKNVPPAPLGAADPSRIPEKKKGDGAVS
jgi:divalent metal cation (Fe/Co/Zn/Cd) transporter